jgi:hypothetical protein
MCSLISREKMMKIVWSIICLQYFGSINKMNLNNGAIFKVISSGHQQPGFLPASVPSSLRKGAHSNTS